MKLGTIAKVAFVSLIVVFMTGCAKNQKITFPTKDLNPQVKSGEYVKKVENFLVIADASSSMFYAVKRTKISDAQILAPPTKLEEEKALIKQMNQTIPYIKLKAGLREFGPKTTEKGLIYGMTDYTRQGLADAVDSIKTTGGQSPLSEALVAAADDLGSSSGNIAVIVFSDGEDMGKETVEAAAWLKSLYGDRLCIYTVHIGNSAKGKGLLAQVAAAGGCGFATTADEIMNADGMADFVSKIFFTADGDSDRDGVPDSRDRCPNTPYGLKVDANGCPLPVDGSATITLHVNFDFDKHDIKPMYHDHLKGVADFMKKYPATTIDLKGYTDTSGPEQYNLNLSNRRANSVRNYLIDKFGIDASRLKAKGYGEADPIASNDTREGRIKNRRTMATITAQ